MDISGQTVLEFREYFPEFNDETKWNEYAIIQALEDADAETGKRWLRYQAKPASIKARGMYNFAAHRLVMNQRAEAGDIGASYAVSSKSVGDESMSFAVPSISNNDLIINGDLPLTKYGLEFLRLRRRAGTGGVML